MKAKNPHYLIGNNLKEINVDTQIYIAWKTLLREKNINDITEFDAFVAGYFMGANFQLKSKIIDLAKEPEYDGRISL